MNVITEHAERYSIRAGLIHTALEAIESRWTAGASDEDIATWFAHRFPETPYTDERIVAEVTDLLEREEAAAAEDAAAV